MPKEPECRTGSDTARRLLESRGRLAALKYIQENGWADRNALEPRIDALAGRIASDEVTLKAEMDTNQRRRTRILQAGGIALAFAAFAGV